MSSSPRVRLKQGTVIGGADTLPNGKPFDYFKGIPYAQPPLGKLRFMPPVPLESFATPEIECITEGNVCFQRNKITGEYCGSEDCLFLNVYCPRTDCDELLPVMVFLHGGAFISGSGNSENYNPLYLMQRNVMVVTLNYRVGPLGFLSYPEGNVSGNAGLKDQRLALQWIQENITEFGGDPNNVTLFGQSAGSVSTQCHVLSKRSKNLFHKAILQSALITMPCIVEKEPSKKTIELATSLGCPSNNPNEIVEFLQYYSNLEDLFAPIFKKAKLESIFLGQLVPSKPVIEEDSDDAAFTKEDFESIYVKDSIDIPIIVGCASADGSIGLIQFITKLDEVDDVLRFFVPSENKHLESVDNLKSAIKRFYFKDQEINKSTLNQLNILLTDHFFIMPAREMIETYSLMQHNSPLYFYMFDFVGNLNTHKQKYKLENIIKGAAHADELNYIFQHLNAPEPWGEREKTMVEAMCEMWTNFAKHGNPSLNGVPWKEVPKIGGADEFTLTTLMISDTIEIVENPYRERIEFWRNLKNKTMN